MISFPFVPNVIFVNKRVTTDRMMFGGLAWIHGLERGSGGSAEEGYYAHFSWNSSSMSWYSTYKPEDQLNVNGAAYIYIALG